MYLEERNVGPALVLYILTIHFTVSVPQSLRNYAQYNMYMEQIETLASSKKQVTVTIIFDDGSTLSITTKFLSVTANPGIFYFNLLYSAYV